MTTPHRSGKDPHWRYHPLGLLKWIYRSRKEHHVSNYWLLGDSVHVSTHNGSIRRVSLGPYWWTTRR